VKNRNLLVSFLSYKKIQNHNVLDGDMEIDEGFLIVGWRTSTRAIGIETEAGRPAEVRNACHGGE
jgi:hypothetical protein